MTNQTVKWFEETIPARMVDHRDQIFWGKWRTVRSVDTEQEGRITAITLDSGSTVRFYGSTNLRVRFMA